MAYHISGVERGICFGGPLFCARDVMANHETIRKVECYRKELTKVMLLLGEIIRFHQMNMLMIQFIVSRINLRIRKRKRTAMRARHDLLDRIPAHIRHINRLVHTRGGNGLRDVSEL
ncbi:putative nuclease HARBI1 [Salvia divinorum]|uniref:Nuclease HARBI1 n=1 Tax=Salvia divinorum TaxID=28513 RepID=A0ABD1HVJ4_SALDI